jgi:glycerol kinase
MAQRHLPIDYPHPLWVSQDASAVWTLTKSCLDEVIQTVGDDRIHAIGVTNQRETSIIWNKETGTPLGPAIGWQCRRTADRCRELMPMTHWIKSKTGLPMDPYFSASKFEWLLHYYSESQALIRRQQLCCGTMDAWLIYNLTQGDTFATDATNASRTMLFNIHTLSYDAELCELFGVPMSTLPEVRPTVNHFGDYIAPTCRIPIYAVIGDQQSALFSQCALNKNRIKNTYGTGLFMMASTGERAIESPDLITTIALRMKGKTHYALEGSAFTGGSLIQWLKDQLGLLKCVTDAESLAMSVDSNGGVCLVPALTGLGAPHWLPTAKGALLGLTQHSTTAHIVRAALESLALQSNDLMTIFNALCGPFNVLMVDGGASRNEWLMQLQADVSGVQVCRPKNNEATARGAALCAAQWKNVWPPPQPPTGIEFSPQEKPSDLLKFWETTLQGFKQTHG